MHLSLAKRHPVWKARTMTPKKPMQPVKWLRVFRDVAIVWAVSLIGTTFAVLTQPNASPGQTTVFWGTIGFFVVGLLTKENRFQHLVSVGVVFWLTTFIDVLFGKTMAECVAAVITRALMVAFGGGLSNLFVKRKPSL